MVPSLRHAVARFVTVAVALAVFLLALAAPASSQGFAKEGTYAGISYLPDFTLDGVTFDGMTGYIKEGGEEVLILPKLEPKNMMRMIVGMHATRGGFEIGYDQTKHVGTFFEFPSEATFHSLDFDERIFLLTRSRVQPYVLLGGSFIWLTIKDGSFLDPDVGDASFRGYGVNTEAGVTVYPHRRFGVSAGYRYRGMWFDHASGVTDTSYKLRPRFRETSGSVTITGLFTF